MPRKEETKIEKNQKVCHTQIDLDSADNNSDQRATPPLIQLDSHDKVDKNQPEPTTTSQIPELNNSTTNQTTESFTGTIIENQPKNLTPTQSSFKPKLKGMAERKASSPMKSPSPKKLSDTHILHNTRPIWTRQSPSLLGERVFTSLVEISHDRPGEHK